MGALEEALNLRELAVKHQDFFRKSIPLIASENIMSPLAMEMLITDLGFRYAEGLPHHRYYQGNIFVDQIEDKVMELANKLFRSTQSDPRPVSGTNANTSVIYGLLKPGDKIATPDLSGGGHISAAKFGAVGLRGLDIVTYPYDKETMTILPDEASKMIIREKPKVCLVGQSVFLFPAPLKELQVAFQEVGCRVWYDGAHVLGLIAGKQFQDPLREGAELITGSTHKTLPGPQHGIILGKTGEETWKSVQRGVFPGTLSNHHLNAMAALGVTLAEEIEFGEDYAKQIIRNSKILAGELSENGIKVLGESRGFTESHTLVADVRKQGGGRKVAEYLEKCGIVLNKNLLPWDDSKRSQDPSGIRIGTQEITRIGFKEKDVRELASIMVNAINNFPDPEKIQMEVKELKSRFTEIKFCFGKMKPYEYIRVFN
ncbi:MAG: serine hydroxymethyltransferase [Candidatus Thermoplasmatota archaeon]|nr:serine hydroxymethyltransferase [Candidatus Thermoplasmatota archaeon]MCL6090140.1 serine hydroxymethyltransferase [Candidatus Thermoplasmatota archaeon]MDA8143383.1 serine hydroxymethyltransferase [Thermoplasmatales archaeon]